MEHKVHTTNKKSQIKWNQYEIHEKEPKENRRYEISPEMEDEVLEYGFFLKQRVRRNMKKMQAQYRKSAHIHQKPEAAHQEPQLRILRDRLLHNMH
jgi:hypothetical protein